MKLEDLSIVLTTLRGLTVEQLEALRVERHGAEWEGLRYLIDIVLGEKTNK